MQDPPAAAELAAAVRQFLKDEAAPALEGRLAFMMRVAVNALGVVERELRLGPAADAEERARLRELLARDGTVDELNRELCRRIRAGEIDEREAALMAHLRATALAKLAIDQPTYSGYLAALGKPPAR